MTYSLGGLIQGSDYNGFVGGGAANVSGQLNTVLSTGRGNAGYGQTAVTNVTAITDTVTAAQWTTLVNGVDRVRKHQSGAGYSNLATYTAGATINATNNISSALSTAYSSRLTAAATATTTGATFSPAFTAPNDTSAQTIQFSRTATFANADAARYFFNAGGQLNFVISSITNTGATSRGADIGNLAVTNFASKTINAADAVARTGTGGTLNTDVTTNYGYYGTTTANVVYTQITSTATAYTGDVFYFLVKTNGVQGSNADNGSILTLSANIFMAAQSPAFNDGYNVSINHRVDVVYPATTFLANTWGSVTIA